MHSGEDIKIFLEKQLDKIKIQKCESQNNMWPIFFRESEIEDLVELLYEVDTFLDNLKELDRLKKIREQLRWRE